MGIADKKLSHPAYRADIDGLRALAVLSVIIFHAFPAIMPGGFVGVDIFFVISGFLIGTIIFSSVEAGKFSYVEFYRRRILRIFPALTLVLVVVLAMGWAVLFSNEFEQLGHHTLAATLFSSNILLWREAGYFATASSYKPLLHLWSLGVEEQFYIFWPLLVGFAWRRWGMLWLTAVLGAASFVLNLGLTRLSPDAAYYLPISRFWELMIGCALAYWCLHKRKGPVTAPNVQSVIGLALVGAGLFTITASSPFPGWRALLPSVGACLLISAGPKAVLNRFVLSNPPMVGIGLISYPLYLWHWPLLSFLYIMEGGVVSASAKLAAIAITLLLAWLTWLLVETPIRRQPRGAQPSLALLSGMIVIGISGTLIWGFGGISSRSINHLNVHDDPPMLVPANVSDQCSQILRNLPSHTTCMSDKREGPVYALVGDSKASVLYPGLVMASKPGGRWMLLFRTGEDSIPLMLNKGSDAIIQTPNIRLVVITFAARDLFRTHDPFLADLPESPNYQQAYQVLDTLISKFHHAGLNVIITVDNPTLADPPLCMTRQTAIPWINALFSHSANNNCSVSIASFDKRTAIYRSLLSNLSAKWQDAVTIYDPTPLLCDSATGICPASMDGHMLYGFTDHISNFASLRIAESLIPVVNRTAGFTAGASPQSKRDQSPK